MVISRRGFLATAGASVVATALDVSRSEGSAEAVAPAVTALTTLDATVIIVDAGDGGYRRLAPGPAEPHIVRTDLTLVVTAPVDIALAAFAQMTDLHIVDDQSPARVEFFDRLANPGPPHFASYPFSAAYRAHECMSTQVVDAMCRAIQKAGHGPATMLPLAFTIVTGDAVDNAQYNETRWYIDLLDGGRGIVPNSGVNRPYDTSVTSDGLGLDIQYWHPANKQDEIRDVGNGGLGIDLALLAGFPEVLQLPSAARAQYFSNGLGMPWYSAYGNHDALVQGNVPIGLDLFGLNVADAATGTFKRTGYAEHLPARWTGSVPDWASALHDLILGSGSFSGVLVPADPARRLLSRAQFIQEHFTTVGSPVGHGFASGSTRAYYVIPDSPGDLIRHIVLDTTYTLGGPNGWLDDTQWHWLESLLRANSSRYLNVDPNTGERTLVTQSGVVDKLFVIYSHHTATTMDNSIAANLEPNPHNGTDLTNLLLRYPNVILWVNGHNHKNKIVSHLQSFVISSGFWEVTTASHIDFPFQSRIIEIGEGAGTLSVFTTMVDIDAPLDFRGLDIHAPATLAALSREVAANDLQERDSGVRNRPGTLQDRNTQLLVPAPFAFPPALLGRKTAPITAVARTTGEMDVFAVAPDGRTMTNWWSTTSGWAGWSQIGGGVAATGGAGSPITAVHRVGQRVEAFTVGGNNRVYTAASEPGTAWTGWSEVPGGLVCRPGSTVTVVARDSNHLDLFTTGSDGRIMSTWWNTNAGWPGSWFNVSGGVAATGSTVTAIARSATHLDVFAIGTDNRVASAFFDGATGWSGWFQVPGTPSCRSDATVTVVARDSNHMDLFTTGSDGRVMSTWWNANAGWGTWFNVSGGTASPGSAVTAVARSATHLDLFTVGTNNQVDSVFFDAATGWSGWFGLSQAAFSGGQVAVVSRTPDSMDVFVVGAGGVDPLPSSGSAVGAVSHSRWTGAAGWPVGWSVVKNTPDSFPSPVIVPDLVGENTSVAIGMIGALGLTSLVNTPFVVDCNATPDVVIGQDPAPGPRNLPPGSTISITVPNTTGCIPK